MTKSTYACMLCGGNCNGKHDKFCSAPCKVTYMANLDERAFVVGMESKLTHTQRLAQQ